MNGCLGLPIKFDQDGKSAGGGIEIGRKFGKTGAGCNI